jgi:hypothetical protein
MRQLALLEIKPKAQSQPVLAVESVPARIALGDRWFLTVQQGERSWFFPIQLTELEAHWLVSRLQGMDWSLDTGEPADIGRIQVLIERAIDSYGAQPP